MVVIPIATFYISYYGLFNGDLDKIMWAGLLAVVATNCVIAAYVMMAWKEDEDEQRQLNGGKTNAEMEALKKPEVKKEL